MTCGVRVYVVRGGGEGMIFCRGLLSVVGVLLQGCCCEEGWLSGMGVRVT